jgi:hypothetical protein
VAVLLCSINRKNERREASDDATFAGAARDRDGRPMKLSVLGAAGATGIPLVEQALAAGHRVTALVRSGPKTDDHQSQPPCCRRRRNRPRSVSEAMNGGDAVISVLGARGPVMTEATRAIVDAAKQKGPSASSCCPPSSPRVTGSLPSPGS